MRSLRVLVLAGALAGFGLVACTGPGAPSIPPAQIGLQSGDLPPELTRCRASGDIDAFARSLQAGSPAAHDELVGAWKALQRGGATAAAVTVYAAQPAACTARLGSGQGTSVTSVVVEFRDDGAAQAAYRSGMLGFTTPNEDAEVPDMTRGAATGLGRNSWVLDRSTQGRAVIIGLWERSDTLVLVMAVDADPLHAKQALSSIDGRII